MTSRLGYHCTALYLTRQSSVTDVGWTFNFVGSSIGPNCSDRRVMSYCWSDVISRDSLLAMEPFKLSLIRNTTPVSQLLISEKLLQPCSPLPPPILVTFLDLTLLYICFSNWLEVSSYVDCRVRCHTKRSLTCLTVARVLPAQRWLLQLSMTLENIIFSSFCSIIATFYNNENIVGKSE